MRPVYLLLLWSATLPAAQEVAVKARPLQHVLVLKEVYLNGQGPFQMVVDTGASACQIRPAVAKRLGLRPAYAVEQVTVASVKAVPAAILDNVRIGPVDDQGIETLITKLHLQGVDGVLGQSWLLRHDYLLDYRGRRVVLDGSEPRCGIRAALRSTDGRPQIAAEIDGRRQDLVVDSGASVLVLFGRPPRVSTATLVTAALVTNSSSVEGGTGRARLKIGFTYNRLVPTAEVAAQPAAGLLPAATFASVYISNRSGIVVLVP
jgi:predicted aspartyl protease